MIEVTGGTFTLGARLQNFTYVYDVSHSVTVSSFMMGKTEVTQAQFEYVMGANPACFSCGGSCNKAANSYASRGNSPSNLPVEYVNLFDMIAYCNKLSILEGKVPCYTVSGVDFSTLTYNDVPHTPSTAYNTWRAVTCDFTKDGYRLPTEREWEYAARGGVKSQSNTGSHTYDYDYAGSNTIGNVAWYAGNNASGNPANGIYGPKPVAQKLPNELRLYDMTGNVCERCWDRNPSMYAPEYSNDGLPYAPDQPYGPDKGDYRANRGYSWFNGGSISVSLRGFMGYDHRDADDGFRVAASIVPASE
jgi:formylglycine-generating enzyme required for sulfatase activity